MEKGFTLEERLYKTEDGEVVREGHADAATIYRGAGQKISFEEARELGLLEDGPAEAESEEGKYEGRLLKDCTDEELLDHFVDLVKEIRDRDIDEDLVESKIPDELNQGDEDSEVQVEIPDGVVPGETPGWPIVNGVVVDLPDQVREELAAVKLEDQKVGEDLTDLSRGDLNKLAADLGIEKPDKIKGGIPKVIEAIEAKRAESSAE